MEVSYFDSLDFDQILNDLATTSNNDSHSDITSDDNNSSNDEHISLIFSEVGNDVPRKRRLRPHTLRHDIRQTYADMFTNVINAMDFRLTYGFFDTYLSPEIFQESQQFSLSTNRNWRSTQHNILSVAKFWHNSIIPDAMMVLRNTQVVTSADNQNNRIILSYRNSGTLIYDLTNRPRVSTIIYGCGYDGDVTGDADGCGVGYSDSGESDVESVVSLRGGENKRKRQQHSHSKYQENNPDPHNPTPTLDEIMSTLEDTSTYLKLLPTPTRIDALGRMIMHTDENHFITRIEFEKSYVQSTYLHVDNH